jgi:enoyl-CoA hydratase/carnithine racemase
MERLMSHAVKYEQEGGVVTLTLNEPETRNALSPAIIDAMLQYVEQINADLSVGCVIITGAGEGFSSGGNVKRMQDRTTATVQKTPLEIRAYYTEGIQRLPLALSRLDAPTIAAVNGAAIGAGCDLATMCDIRIAGRSAKFGESFVRMGLVSGDGGAWYLPKAVGLSKAYEMTFTGDFVDAEEAARIGLVSKVVDDALLLDEARAMANRIASHPVHSIRMSKRLIRDSHQVSLPIALDMAAASQALVQTTQDHKEAVQAFAEKRKPKFVGK